MPPEPSEAVPAEAGPASTSFTPPAPVGFGDCPGEGNNGPKETERPTEAAETTEATLAEVPATGGQERFRRIVEGASVGIHLYQLTDDGRLLLLDANPASERAGGGPSRLRPGQPLESVFPKLAQSPVAEQWRRVARTGQPWQATDLVLPDHPVPAAFDVWAYQTLPGQVAVMFGDVTSRLLAQRDLVRAKETAEAANRAKSDFLAIMSHEMRTPLNPIIGFTSLMLEEHPGEPQKTYLRMIQESGQLLTALIQEILDFSKIEHGEVHLDEVPFRLPELLQEILASIQPKCGTNRLEVGSFAPALGYTPATDLTFLGDPLKLLQVITNLLTNACKFTSQGTITLRLGARTVGPDQWECRTEVEDTGIGIPPARLEHIFDPFTQVDSSLSRRYGGVGLGLAICRRLVHAMGGRIGVESQIERGSTFWFTIPVHRLPDRPANRPTPPIPDAGTNFSDLRVLLVEDQEGNRCCEIALLEQLGCHPMVASDAPGAWLLLANHPCDLLLLDLGMPGEDGISFSRRVRAHSGALSHLPILAVSAHLEDPVRQACLEAGIDHFLAKPVTPESLQQALRLCLEIAARRPPTPGPGAR